MKKKEKNSILIVDDEPANIVALRLILKPKFNIYSATDGKTAIKAATEESPDIILLDVLMPEMDGYDVIKMLKSNEETSRIPVIFIAAMSDVESELEGLSLGAIDYIYKPFSVPLLFKRIEVHLLVESQKRELMEQKKELLQHKEELTRFNKNLQEMVDAKTKTVMQLQNAVLKTMTELVECRNNTNGGHIERTDSEGKHSDPLLVDMFYKVADEFEKVTFNDKQP